MDASHTHSQVHTTNTIYTNKHTRADTPKAQQVHTHTLWNKREK